MGLESDFVVGHDSDLVVSAVRFGVGVREAIQRHVLVHPDRDVGGVLVGHYGGDGSAVVITAIIPALDAGHAGGRVSFGPPEWQRIHRDLPQYMPQSIVGWYRGHRGSGDLLGEDDVHIHRRFFSGSRQVALFVDPDTRREEWFGWSPDEVAQMRRHAAFPAASQARSQPIRSSDHMRLWTQRVACVLVGIVTGSVIWFGALRNNEQATSRARASGSVPRKHEPSGTAHPIVVEPQAGVESGAASGQSAGGG
jgi:hypothetical protein